MNEVLDIISRLEESIAANSIGLQNVYGEFNKYKLSDISNKIEALNKRLDHYEKDRNVTDFGLDIQPYPFNIRVSFIIRANFGEISQIIDYPPALEYKMGNWISHVYASLLDKLYEEHDKKGGKHIGEEGFKDFMDEHGKTIIKLEPQLSKR